MKILITGATGYLGQFVVKSLLDSEHQLFTLGRRALKGMVECGVTHFDLENELTDLKSLIDEVSPDAVLHIAAVASAGVCEEEPELANAINVELTAALALACSELGVRMVYTSTDLVFEGIADCPEEGISADTAPSPLSVYAQTKVRGEEAVLGIDGGVVARLSLLFGPPAPYDGKGGPAGWMIEAFRGKRQLTLFSDEWRAPVFVGDAARFLILLAQGLPQNRIYHISGPTRLSRVEMGEKLANLLGADHSLITRRLRREVESRPTRPQDVSLCSSEFRKEFGAQPVAIEEALRGIIC